MVLSKFVNENSLLASVGATIVHRDAFEWKAELIFTPPLALFQRPLPVAGVFLVILVVVGRRLWLRPASKCLSACAELKGLKVVQLATTFDGAVEQLQVIPARDPKLQLGTKLKRVTSRSRTGSSHSALLSSSTTSAGILPSSFEKKSIRDGPGRTITWACLARKLGLAASLPSSTIANALGICGMGRKGQLELMCSMECTRPPASSALPQRSARLKIPGQCKGHFLEHRILRHKASQPSLMPERVLQPAYVAGAQNSEDDQDGQEEEAAAAEGGQDDEDPPDDAQQDQQTEPEKQPEYGGCCKYCFYESMVGQGLCDKPICMAYATVGCRRQNCGKCHCILGVINREA